MACNVVHTSNFPLPLPWFPDVKNCQHGIFLEVFDRGRGTCDILASLHMEKNFDAWNERKKQINGKETAPFCHERELW